MKLHWPILVLILTGTVGAAAWLKHDWAGHTRRMAGEQNSTKAACFNCHFVSAARLAWAKPRPHHDSPAGLAISPDGTKVFVALDDRDEVVEVNLAARKIVRRVRVAGRPFGIALDARGRNLFVTCRDRDRLAVVDVDQFQEISSAPVGLSPVAVAFCQTTAGDRLIVANSMSDDVSILSADTLQEVGRLAAGREPFAVTTATDGSRAFVANRLVNLESVKNIPESEITEIDPAKVRVTRRVPLDSGHLSEGICATASRGWVLTPFVKVHNLVPITQVADGWVMSSGLAVADLKRGEVVQIPLDEPNGYFSDPSGVAVDPLGKRAFVASGGGDAVTVVDLERLFRWLATAGAAAKREAINDLSLSPEYVVARIPTKRNPQQLAISPDGNTLLVAERLNDSILVVDANSLHPLGRIALGDGGLDDPIRRGERMFTTAAYTFQHQFSCRSCHPDGHVDGLAYDFDTSGVGDNFLDNRSLLAVAGTEPFKWTGKNPSLEVQCGPRFAKVLMRTDPFPQKELHDLTAYIKSLAPPRMSFNSGRELTPAQERGRKIFFATRTPDGREIPYANRCSACHRPPLYTVKLPFNVGSGGDFDTPHLLGIGTSAPYLHDGRAQTLEEIWTVYGTNDVHGVTSYMNKEQLNDLVEFLKTL